MSQIIVRDNAIKTFTAGVDLTGLEGYPVQIREDDYTLVHCDDFEGSRPLGVLLKGGKVGEPVSVAIAHGGFAGTVRVKVLDDFARPGTVLQLSNDSICAFTRSNGSGSRIEMAAAVEAAKSGELVEAVLFRPITYMS